MPISKRWNQGSVVPFFSNFDLAEVHVLTHSSESTKYLNLNINFYYRIVHVHKFNIKFSFLFLHKYSTKINISFSPKVSTRCQMVYRLTREYKYKDLLLRCCVYGEGEISWSENSLLGSCRLAKSFSSHKSNTYT